MRATIRQGSAVKKSRLASGTMNRLAGASSPYLLQHAGNPVDWQPWDEEAFAAAREAATARCSCRWATARATGAM